MLSFPGSRKPEELQGRKPKKKKIVSKGVVRRENVGNCIKQKEITTDADKSNNFFFKKKVNSCPILTDRPFHLTTHPATTDTA